MIHVVMGVKGPFMGIKVGFDFFHGHLNDFNIVLITGTQVMVAEMEGIFGVGVEFLSNIKNVLIEEWAVDFFPVFIRFDMLNI